GAASDLADAAERAAVTTTSASLVTAVGLVGLLELPHLLFDLLAELLHGVGHEGLDHVLEGRVRGQSRHGAAGLLRTLAEGRLGAVLVGVVAEGHRAAGSDAEAAEAATGHSRRSHAEALHHVGRVAHHAREARERRAGDRVAAEGAEDAGVHSGQAEV